MFVPTKGGQNDENSVMTYELGPGAQGIVRYRKMVKGTEWFDLVSLC